MDIFGMQKLLSFKNGSGTTDLTSLNLKSFASTVDPITKLETNTIRLQAGAIANEAVNRDLGFQNEIMKTAVYSAGYNPKGLYSGTMKSEDLKDKSVKIFKDEYMRLLSRGYTQSQARKMAHTVANKYIDDEKSFILKKMAL